MSRVQGDILHRVHYLYKTLYVQTYIYIFIYYETTFENSIDLLYKILHNQSYQNF